LLGPLMDIALIDAHGISPQARVRPSVSKSPQCVM
jgi:hypothetical protein